MMTLGSVIETEYQVICHAYGMLVLVPVSLSLFHRVGDSLAYEFEILLAHL